MTLRTHASLFATALFLTLPLAAQDTTIALIGTTKVEIDLSGTRTECVCPLATVLVARDLHEEVMAPLLAATRGLSAPVYVQTATIGADGIRLGNAISIDDGIEGGQTVELEQLRVRVAGPEEGYETRTLLFSILMPMTGWQLRVARVERSHEAVRTWLVLTQGPGLGMPALEEVHAKLAIGEDDLLYAATYLGRPEVEGEEPVFELVDLTRLMK